MAWLATDDGSAQLLAACHRQTRFTGFWLSAAVRRDLAAAADRLHSSLLCVQQQAAVAAQERAETQYALDAERQAHELCAAEYSRLRAVTLEPVAFHSRAPKWNRSDAMPIAFLSYFQDNRRQQRYPVIGTSSMLIGGLAGDTRRRQPDAGGLPPTSPLYGFVVCRRPFAVTDTVCGNEGRISSV